MANSASQSSLHSSFNSQKLKIKLKRDSKVSIEKESARSVTSSKALNIILASRDNEANLSIIKQQEDSSK